MRTKLTADDKLCFLLQKLLILGTASFFVSFAGWIAIYIFMGDPFAKVLGPVVIGLLMSIMVLAWFRGVWVVASEGRKITRAERGTPERMARDSCVSAHRYEITAGSGVRAASGLNTAMFTATTTALAQTAWTPGRGMGPHVSREEKPTE